MKKRNVDCFLLHGKKYFHKIYCIFGCDTICDAIPGGYKKRKIKTQLSFPSLLPHRMAIQFLCHSTAAVKKLCSWREIQTFKISCCAKQRRKVNLFSVLILLTLTGFLKIFSLLKTNKMFCQ
jgi:hypothetical protein